MLEPSPGPIERVVLIDFGFASFEGGAKLTQQGTVVGSLADALEAATHASLG